MNPSCRPLLGVVIPLVVGCRAIDADPIAPPPVEDAGSDAAPIEPTRAEPPVVHATPTVMVDTLAGSGAHGGKDGIGAAAEFANPVGVALDSAGAVIATEYDGGRVRRIDPTTGATTTLATGLNEPFGIVVASDGSIYVQTDRNAANEKGDNTGTIWKLSPGGGAPELVVSELGRPRGLAQLLDGRIVLSDRDRFTVSALDPVGRSLTVLAGDGSSGFVDGFGASARFAAPYGVGVLPDGNLVIADHANHCIRKVEIATGAVTVFAGDGKPGMKDDPDKLQARFDFPIDVVADAVGNVYVSDSGNHRIRRIKVSGEVETIAGDGTAGYADGEGLAAKFYAQEQIEVTPDGKTLYVADGTGGDETHPPFNRIRRIRIP